MEYLIILTIVLIFYFVITRALTVYHLYLIMGPWVLTQFNIILFWTCPIWADFFLYPGVLYRALIILFIGVDGLKK